MSRHAHRLPTSTLLAVVLAACSSEAEEEEDVADAGVASAADAGLSTDAAVDELVDAGSNGSQLASTLTSDCATLQGRAIVNFNGNLGISFTEADSPFTFLGSIQFEIPSGFNGTIPNPENWDGNSERQIVAVSSPAFSLHGNHCWFDNPGASGTVVISDYRPSEGIVKAQLNSLVLRSCSGPATCTISGSIETTGQGVFE